MQTNCPTQKIEKLFAEYLSRLNISVDSLKNYTSDLNHFTGWLILKIRSYGVYASELTEAIPFLSRDLAQEYKNFLIENKISVKSVNRRLSTLRHLSQALTQAQVVSSDFMAGIRNIAPEAPKKENGIGILIADFERQLLAEKVSSGTAKNYLSDIRQFFAWVEKTGKVSGI